MDFTEARAVFCKPRDGGAPPPGTDAGRTPARALRDAIEPIAMVSFWCEPANAAYAEHGLDFLTGYTWSRASPLGEPSGAVVAAAFGAFEPGLIAGLYDTARESCSLAEIREIRERAGAEGPREVLTDADGADSVAEVLDRGLSAAETAGRPMFAGLSALPAPADPLGALWHACTRLRELRGDAHLAACGSVGLSGLAANILTELYIGFDLFEYTGTRGWAPEAMQGAAEALAAVGLLEGGALTGQGRALRAEVEQRTDGQLQPVVDAIGPDLDGVIGRLDDWSAQVVDHGWFPPDPYKRAAG